MKKQFFFLCFAIMSFAMAWGHDHIIFRNGNEMDVKLEQISDDQIVYKRANDRSSHVETVPTKDVYMVFIEKQGNVYLTPEGKRISGEDEKSKPKAGKKDIIYLVKGQEIGADMVRVTADGVEVVIKEKGGLLNKVGIGSESSSGITFPRDEVFMVRYRNGMRDVITPIDVIEEEEVVEEVKPSEPQIEVKFHQVQKGETLAKIAEAYGVDPKDIIEWNDLPARSNVNNPLKADMQLLIYVTKE